MSAGNSSAGTVETRLLSAIDAAPGGDACAKCTRRATALGQ
jgi:hypothetical protein